MKEFLKYENRLNNMIAGDIKETAFGLDKLIKAEMVNILKNYFILTGDDVDVNIEPINGGRYSLSVKANIRGVKKIKKIL